MDGARAGRCSHLAPGGRHVEGERGDASRGRRVGRDSASALGAPGWRRVVGHGVFAHSAHREMRRLRCGVRGYVCLTVPPRTAPTPIPGEGKCQYVERSAAEEL